VSGKTATRIASKSRFTEKRVSDGEQAGQRYIALCRVTEAEDHGLLVARTNRGQFKNGSARNSLFITTAYLGSSGRPIDDAAGREREAPIRKHSITLAL
jgi:hypothetical protein